MSRPTVHLVHGFNVADYGSATVGKLAPFFEERGFSVRVHGYRWTWLFTLRARNQRVAKALAEVVEPGDVLVGHSNGCAIIDQCLSRYAWRRGHGFGIIYINPALPREQPMPSGSDWLHVYSAKSDEPVVWGSRLRRWTSWLPWSSHPWGAMGAYGYVGDDPRVTQTYMDDRVEGRGIGHSGVFEEPHLSLFGEEMAQFAAEQSGVTAGGGS